MESYLLSQSPMGIIDEKSKEDEPDEKEVIKIKDGIHFYNFETDSLNQ